MITNLVAMASDVIFLVWLLLCLPWFNQIKLRQSIIIGLLIIGAFYLPIYHNFNLIQLCRGTVGGLSITTSLLLFISCIKRLWGKPSKVITLNFAWIIASMGLLLYLSTFSIIKTDLYQLGYFPRLLLLLFILAELYLWQVNKWIAWVWLLALIAFYFKLQESNNLWDYLFDPVLWILSLVTLIRQCINKVKR